eukprot:Skav224787  [mRNA]  locus=scaffold764:4437:22368:+ [translate_table: standard]
MTLRWLSVDPACVGSINFHQLCAGFAVLTKARKLINYREYLQQDEVVEYRRIFKHTTERKGQSGLTKSDLDKILRRMGVGSLVFDVKVSRVRGLTKFRDISPETCSARELWKNEQFTVQDAVGGALAAGACRRVHGYTVTPLCRPFVGDVTQRANPMEEVRALRQDFLAAGGSAEVFSRLGQGGLALGDEALQDGALKPGEMSDWARSKLRPGSLMEYHCYNDAGRAEGTAVIRFEQWDSEADLRFRATHLVASDGYYEYWASRNLPSNKAEYHLCQVSRQRCRVGGRARPRVVHILRWRLVGPQNLLAPVGGGDRPVTTTGLDDALRGGSNLDDPRMEDFLQMAKSAKRQPPQSGGEGEKKRKKTFGGDLAEKARAHEERGRAREREKDQKRSRTRSKRKHRKREKSSDGEEYSASSEGKASSEEGQVFREASHREVDLVQMSRQNPGCLLRSALREMNRYMAARGEALSEETSHNRVLSYLRQILLPQYPKAGLRSQRELVTIATSLDALLDGNLGCVGDVLAQRFKAIESSLAAEGSWQVARHHELIPSSATLATKTELTEAAKAEAPGARAVSGSRSSCRRAGSWERSEGSSRGSSYSPSERSASGESEESWSSSTQRSISIPHSPGGLEEHEEWEEVRRFAYNCWKMDAGSKSMSQMAVLLVQLVHHCPGVVGKHSEDLLNSASKQGTGVPWRDVLPLPVPEDVEETVKEVLTNREVKVKKRPGMSGGAVKGAYRKTGVDCLVYCMIVGLNCMWGGLRRGTRIHRGAPRAGQLAALDRLQQAAIYVVDSKDGAEKGGIPRSPDTPWDEVIAASSISYQGELVEKAEPLELERVLASLPPEGSGGSVNILDLCEGKVKELVANPELNVLPAEELPDTLPLPRVLVKDGEWEKIAKALYDRGILEPTENVLTHRGSLVQNGMFGVRKVGKDLPDGRPAQRLIMDLRGSNSVLKIIGGDIATLAGASAFTNIILEDGKLITISGDDLCSSFYLFRLPDAWKPFLSFERSVSWRALGVDRDGDTYMAAVVLPMGFASSVGLMQHIHRRLALWKEPWGAGLSRELEVRKDRQWPHLGDATPVWALYLDDTTFIRKLELEVAETLVGRPAPEQENMRRAYQYWGIPYNGKKAVEECEQAERLGSFLDGRRGRVGVTVKRLLENMSLGIWLLGQGQTTQKALQVFCGKEVHTLQFRRPLFSVFDEIWKLIMDTQSGHYLTRKVCEEIVTSLALAPLRFTDWRSELDPYVMAGDASESGGAFVIARRLTQVGVAEALKDEGRDEEQHNGVVIIDFFAGIGGLLRSLERCGLKWEHHVVIGQDPACRRLIRRTWPGGAEFTDVTKVSLAELVKEINKVESPTLVVAGGGSPCQGFSKLSTKRKHFADQRSGLFYNFADLLEGLQGHCKDNGIKFLGFCENVVMDEADRDEISFKLGYRPHLVESGDVSRVRRPRFYWLSEDLPSAPWLEVTNGQVASSVRLKGDLGPEGLWLPPDWKWSGSGTDRRFPTFTRPIVRQRPPIDPAGLKSSSQEARLRRRDDQFWYPPYTYEEKYLIQSPSGILQKLPAQSREALMGFRRGHTLKLDREMFEKSTLDDAEDICQAVIGNSFHTTTVALLLGPILGKLGALSVVKGPDELLSALIMEHEESESEYSIAMDSSASMAHSTLSVKEFDEEAMQVEHPQDDLNEETQSKTLMSRLVGHFLRKVELKGSDIRLDSDVIFKPGSCPRSAVDPDKWEWRHGRAFKWRFQQHINLLELKALLHSVQLPLR